MTETAFAIIQTFVGNIPIEIIVNRLELAEGRICYAENDDNTRICFIRYTYSRAVKLK
jgi:hypothetical protein